MTWRNFTTSLFVKAVPITWILNFRHLLHNQIISNFPLNFFFWRTTNIKAWNLSSILLYSTFYYSIDSKMFVWFLNIFWKILWIYWNNKYFNYIVQPVMHWPRDWLVTWSDFVTQINITYISDISVSQLRNWSAFWRNKAKESFLNFCSLALTWHHV